MSSPTGPDPARRRFLASTPVLTCLTSIPWVTAPVLAEATDMRPSTRTALIVDPRLQLSESSLQPMRANGTVVLQLAGDVVRFWQSDACAILREPGTRILGLTRWSDLLVLRGLAAETRRHLRHEAPDQASGAIAWMIS